MTLPREELAAAIRELFETTPGNRIEAGQALPGCEGLVMYEPPLLGIASAADPLFEKYRDPAVIGKPYMPPEEWLPGARSVISFFLPFTPEVKEANRQDPEVTADEWLHARIEGQKFIGAFSTAVAQYLEQQGARACAPAVDERFDKTMRPFQKGDPSRLGLHFASAWSERHAAYAAGLGTFSLTRGLISEKGVAGRYGSVITDLVLDPDQRPYTGIYDYCIRCGACIKRCPAGAISLKRGKDQMRCGLWVMSSKKKYAPRYGCGKCQVGVPCESVNPSRRKA